MAVREEDVRQAREDLRKLKQVNEDQHEFYGLIRLMAESADTLISDLEERLQDLER